MSPSSVADADAVVIGSGPNGLVAAAVLARAGWSVVVLERAAVAGGAVRSEELTLPGYVHDSFSAFYGILHSSPVFHELGLDERVRWARHEAPVAAMVSPREVAVCHAGPEATAAGLAEHDAQDGQAWLGACRSWQHVGRHLFQMMLAPLPSIGPTVRFLTAARVRGTLEVAKTQLEPLESVAGAMFRREAARALFASGITHTDLGVDAIGSTPFALILGMVAQHIGMPVPVGGAGRLADALVRAVEDADGSVLTGQCVRRVVVERGRAVAVETAEGAVFRARRAVVADTGVVALFRDLVGEEHVPPSYREGLRRFRHGTGMFKVDLALRGAVPWSDERLARCGVVHVTGTLDDMARAAFQAGRGDLPERPSLVVGQQSVADPTRAPAGGHTLWIEMHVPPTPREGPWAEVRDRFLERVLDRLETHAPGVRDLIAGTHVRTPADLEAENPNLVGGDVAGGATAVDQQLIFRPVPGWFRYATPVKGLYLCSASAHPGGAVHGMGGRNAARRVLRDRRLRLSR